MQKCRLHHNPSGTKAMWNCCAVACGKERFVTLQYIYYISSPWHICPQWAAAQEQFSLPLVQWPQVMKDRRDVSQATKKCQTESQVNDFMEICSQVSCRFSTLPSCLLGTLKFRPNLITNSWISFIGLCSHVARHLAGHLCLALLHMLCKSPKNRLRATGIAKIAADLTCFDGFKTRSYTFQAKILLSLGIRHLGG